MIEVSDPGVALGAHVEVLASVMVPMVIATALWVTGRPDRTGRGALLLATMWNAVGLLAINVVAVRAGWWSFGEAGPTLQGVPVALWLGWTILWGAVAAQSPLRPVTTLAALFALDIVYMPLLGESVHLGGSWLIGEVVAIGLVAWPGLLLAEWSRSGRRLFERALLQMALFATTLGWAIPALAGALVDRELAVDVPPIALGAVVGLLGIASLPGLVAVNEFFLAGGTPWPWDSTERPVRSGPYRYLRSPMQASGVMVVAVTSIVYSEPAILLAAVAAVAYSRLFCEIEAEDLSARFGDRWSGLAEPQRRWLPSVRPSHRAEPAVAYVSFGCEVCSPVAAFMLARDPVALEVLDASEHPDALVRMRYERADGVSFSGVAAVGACLEHINVGWAMLGWLLRLPVARNWWQLVGDAVGFGPRPVPLALTQNPLAVSEQKPPLGVRHHFPSPPSGVGRGGVTDRTRRAR